MSALQQSSQSSDLYMIENLWQNLIIAVHMLSIQSEFELLCEEERVKLFVSKCAKEVETNPKDCQLYLHK